MKVGTIIKNNWASDENPTKYSIYTGIKGDYATGFCILDNKIHQMKYYKNDFQDRTVFEEVGFCNFMEVIKNDLDKARSKP